MFSWRNHGSIAVAALVGLVVQVAVMFQASDVLARGNPFDGIKYWAYQLDNLNAQTQARIARSPFDLVVIDYAKGVEAPQVPLTRSEVAAMQRKPDGSRRMIIAYLSIGEAENYRYYWPSRWNRSGARPSWIRKESKEWEGNFLVRYWDRRWQDIIFGNPNSYVDRILKAGFDGFYIDRTDAYYRFGDTSRSRRRMRDFITRLSGYIKERHPGAGIMIQNAEELLTNNKFVRAIDAIAKEDLVYGISHKEVRNPSGEIRWSTKLLERAQKRGKRIFVVEYLKRRSNIKKAQNFMRDHDFVLYYGPRGLFEIRENVVPGWKPGAAYTARPSVVAAARPVVETPVGSVAGVAGARDCLAIINYAKAQGTIQFKTASSRLDSASYGTLDLIADSAGQCPSMRLEIGGHTDSDGTPNRNRRLSKRRAMSVVRYLADAGVSRSRLTAVGYGQSEPLVPNNSRANKARNRRIEFKVLSR